MKGRRAEGQKGGKGERGKGRDGLKGGKGEGEKGRNGFRTDVCIGAALALFTFLLIVTTANDIGITYDEPVYTGEALRAREWMDIVGARLLRGEVSAPFDRDLIERYWRGKDMQPSLLKLAIAVVAPTAGLAFPGLSAYRAATALFAAVMVAATFAFGRVALNRVSALFGALLLLFIPQVFALAHLASLDIPVAAMTVLTTLLFYHAVNTQQPRWFVAAGGALGLSWAAKMNAVLIVPAVAVWILLRRTRARRNTFLLLASCTIAFVVFFASWPYLWLKPGEHLAAYARFHFQHYPVHVSYFGQIYKYAPWHYPVVMIAITTPLVALTFMVSGAVSAGIAAWKRRGVQLLWMTSAAFQLAAFMSPGTPKYNGVRLFVAVFPFLCLFAASAFETLSQKLLTIVKNEHGIAHLQSKLAVVLMLFTLLPGTYDTMDSHPFGMSFYNAALGSTRGAWRRGFEATYWGDAFFQIMPFLNEHAPSGSEVFVIPGTVDWLFRHYQRMGLLRDDLRITGDDVAGADFIVFHARQSEMTPLARRLLERGKFAASAQYGGATIVAVVKRGEVELELLRAR